MDKTRRHELRKELKLLKMSNMKLRKALRLAMRVRLLNRRRLEADVTQLNIILSTLKKNILRKTDDTAPPLTEQVFTNPEAATFNLQNDLELKYPNINENDKTKAEYRFYCDRCDFKCTKKSPFDIHMRRHTGERPYVCSMCPRSFVARYELTLHQGKHSNKRIYQCNECNYSTYRPDMLVNHTEKHSGIKTHQCDLCDFRTDEKFRLILHKKTHTPGGLLECVACENAKNNIAMKNSLKAAQTEKTPSSENDDISSNIDVDTVQNTDENNIPETEIEHTCGRRWICKICDTSFKKRESLTKHMRTHTGERPFRCEWCDYAASAKHTLIIHQRRHSGDKPYICDQCSFRCTTKGYLKIHLNKHKGVKPFGCDQCDYRSVDSCKLSAHRKVHHNCEKPYACDICPFRAKLNSRLQQHVRIHAPRPFVCPHCGRTFTTRRALSEHEGFHTGDQPFKCEICKTEKRFTLEISYRRHIDRHKLKFGCHICSYRTGLNKDLHRHMKIHQRSTYPRKRSENILQCDLCKFSCTNADSLNNHLYTNHQHANDMTPNKEDDSHRVDGGVNSTNVNHAKMFVPTVQPTSAMYSPNISYASSSHSEVNGQEPYALHGARGYIHGHNIPPEYQTPMVSANPAHLSDNKHHHNQPLTDAIYNVILANFPH